MDPWVWALVGLGLVFVILIAFLVRGRHRRREALTRQAAFRAQQASTPARPTKELVDLALKQREEALVGRRRQMDAAAEAARHVPATLPSAAADPRRMPVIDESPMETQHVPSEPAINPVQKMAMEQWEDVNVVSPAAKPLAAPLRAAEESFEFQTRPASKPRSAPPRKGHEEAVVETRPPTKPTGSPRKTAADSLAFAEPSAPANKHDPVLDADRGDIEVRRDVKKRDAER